MAPIARIWRGTVETVPRRRVRRLSARHRHRRHPRARPGNITVYLLRRDEDGLSHFQTVSIWESEEAIEAFSGSKDRTARLEPRDEEFLVSSEPEAEHNEIALGLPGQP